MAIETLAAEKTGVPEAAVTAIEVLAVTGVRGRP
jgi:hypothetical protein